MSDKRKLMLLSYYATGMLSLIRVLVTLWLLFYPVIFPLRYIQFVNIVIYLVFNFMYFKLYIDSVPVISIVLPTLLHITLMVVFNGRIVILPFAILLLLDILFLISRGVKSNLFPFDFDSDASEDEWLFELD